MSAPLDVLEDLHTELAKQLLEKIRSGEATAADFNVARAFLRDNRIEAKDAKGTPLRALAEEIPVEDDDADEAIVMFSKYR